MTRRYMDLWNNLGFSLCTVPSVCYMVTTSNERKKFKMEVSTDGICHIQNSKTCLIYVWLQYNIKFPWLFGLICAQNSIGSLVLYNRLNSTKSPQLFHFIWVKICGHIHLCLLPNYLLQTLQIYSDFTQSFPLFKSELLYSVLLMKHLLRDLF